jgi:hypothetical protein
MTQFFKPGSSWQFNHLYLRELTGLLLIILIARGDAFSQNITKKSYSKSSLSSTLDSIWSFSPGSVNISAGMCVPLGKLSEYYNPCFQLGLGFGFKISSKVRFDLGISPRFLIQKKKPEFIINNTVTEAKTPISASMGGWVAYRMFRNKFAFAELVTGFHYEPLNIDNPKPTSSKDSVLNISTWGITLGMNTWLNISRKQNFGLRVMYNYAPYNKDKMLVSNIGGHLTSVSLCYKFPKRDASYKRDYEKKYRDHNAYEPLVLQHRDKKNKYKKLYLDRYYAFKTSDTIYYSKIIAFNDTTITITRWLRGMQTDTTHFKNYRGKMGKDTVIISRKYIVDTLAISNSNILFIEKDWFKNRQWLEPFGYFAIGAALGVVLLPFAALDEGKEGIHDWAVFEGILVGISAPALFIGTRKTKYDLKNKWVIKSGQDNLR